MYIYICNNDILLGGLGRAYHLLVLEGSIHGIIDTVKKFRYCKGIQDSEYVALNEQNFVKEVWSKSGNEYYSYLP